MQDKVLIIIPVLNGENILGDTLEKIKELDYLDWCVFIDDCSTDNTLSILRSWESQLSGVYALEKNGQKIGSIKKVLNRLSEEGKLTEYVVLTDADTFIYNHNTKDAISRTVGYMEQEGLEAVGLKDVPFGDSFIQRLQYWEYISDRAMHVFLSRKKHMRCIPGAGGVYKSKALLEVLESHSLRHAGDDMETTAIIQKLGYKVGYFSSDIEARTLVPRSFQKLAKQRIRWTIGAMETYIKERNFYFSMIFHGNRYGYQILYETLKLLTYAGWYYALVVNPVWNIAVGYGATFTMAFILFMITPESQGLRLRGSVWIVPTSLMIFIVDIVRLPVAYIVVIYNSFPVLEATTDWADVVKYPIGLPVGS